jgi:4-nitrophenyl phosphatase
VATKQRHRSDGAFFEKWVKEDVDTFIFDCDGVLWTGDNVIPGSREALLNLRSLNKRIIFLSNSAVKKPSDLVKKAHKLGLSVEPQEVITSGIAAARQLSAMNLPVNTEIYVVGEKGLRETITNITGFQCVGEQDSGNFADFSAFVDPTGGGFSRDSRDSRESAPEDDGTVLRRARRAIDPSGKIKAVVVSRDGSFDYFRMARASALLRYNQDMPFIATNSDQASPSIGSALLVPAAGAMVSAGEFLTDFGRYYYYYF